MLNGYGIHQKLNSMPYFHDVTQTKKRREQLAQNYRKRVEGFLRNIAMETSYNLPSLSTSKLLGSPRIIVKSWKSEKERIQESIQSNMCLMTEPIKRAADNHDFRPRDLKREIQPRMSFSGSFRYLHDSPVKTKERKSYFKAAASVYMQCGSLKVPEERDIEKELDLETIDTPKGERIRFQLQQTIRSESEKAIQRKTENEFRELFTNPFFLRERKNGIRKMVEEEYYKEEARIERDKGKSSFTTLFNNSKDRNADDIPSLAKKVLIQYNIHSRKNSKCNTLHKGNGMLISSANALKTNREIYRQLNITSRNNRSTSSSILALYDNKTYIM